MGYKRANWHSGLTYQQICGACRQMVRYTDHALDFRPWYPDGFVYCPRCKSPIRHDEIFAIDGNKPEAATAVATPAPEETKAVETKVEAPKTEAPKTEAPASEGERPRFCSGCGKKFSDTDNFCSGCGKKR